MLIILNYSIKSGYDLIEKLSTVNKFCPIIYFSGTNPHPKITHDATGKLDACYYIEKNDFFSAKMLKEIEEIWNLKDVKKVIENRKESLEAELFNYVLNMDSDEKASWYKETEKGEGANWENFMVKIFDSEISVHELFVSAYVDNYSTLAINGKVRMLLLPDLANALKVDAKDCLQKYLSLSLSEKVETESIIHKIALNYSLNILSVLIEYEETDQVCALNKYNINYSNATDDFKAKKYDINFMDKWSLFINKLALRRVCFLVYYLATNNKTSYSSYGLNDISLIEPEIFCLFKEGFTHPKKSSKKIY
ncbi:MAG: hypothetical protein IPL55_09965 [Saprospiraceae bacterium]|nr:hypothetical protein [Saprospiraceae bacterium]